MAIRDRGSTFSSHLKIPLCGSKRVRAWFRQLTITALILSSTQPASYYSWKVKTAQPLRDLACYWFRRDPARLVERSKSMNRPSAFIFFSICAVVDFVIGVMKWHSVVAGIVAIVCGLPLTGLLFLGLMASWNSNDDSGSHGSSKHRPRRRLS